MTQSENLNAQGTRVEGKVNHRRNVSVGVVQTTLDQKKAWSTGPPIGPAEDSRAWQEILRALRALSGKGLQSTSPDFVVFPELSIPRTRLRALGQILAHMGSIGVVGADYRVDGPSRSVVNEGLIVVPRSWPKRRSSKYARFLRFGKTFGAPTEVRLLGSLSPPMKFVGDPTIWVADAGELGRFGVCICYDFMDVERALVYRGAVHHLFVVAYNRDVALFRALASTLSRTIYCNVVICNTGVYGGSIAVSPYYEAFERTVYGQDGLKLFSAQTFSLPLADLTYAQKGDSTVLGSTPDTKKKDGKLKDPPPGFKLVH